MILYDILFNMQNHFFNFQVEEQMHKEMQVSIPKYGEETAVTDAWDAAQEHVRISKLFISGNVLS